MTKVRFFLLFEDGVCGAAHWSMVEAMKARRELAEEFEFLGVVAIVKVTWK